MLLTHAITLAEARSYVAALADHAGTFDASIAYEGVLLWLDQIHGDNVPALDDIPTQDRDVLYTLAEAAIEDLVGHGADALQIELLLATLEQARDQDQP
jgi:copper oxidase (laccase) domain-containing protein